MFDIDGTLVDSNGFDGEIYAQTIRSLLGVEVDTNWDRYTNVTDSGILSEVLDDRGFRGNRGEIEAQVKREFVRRTEDYMAHRVSPISEIAGARALIELLSSKNAMAVAIATGGWRETAVLKLQAIGIDPDKIPMATASDATNRCAIMRLAERRSLKAATALRKTYFGDGHWDQRASAELGYSFVAVGSGVRHHTTLTDLSDHAAILAQLGV